MTDQQIIMEVLKKNGLDEQAINSKLERCMEVMINSFNRVIHTDEIVVLSGVRELLEELSKYSVLMGLVTGNLKPIAFGKLKTIGLDSYFKVGGFGNEDVNRTNLVKLVIRKTRTKFDFRVSDNVFF